MGQLTINPAHLPSNQTASEGNVRSTSVQIDSGLIPHNIPAAVAILSEAHQYASSLDRDVWEFALELQNLSAAGVSINDLRWLACNGYVNHGEELEQTNEGHRVFRTYPGLGFTQRSCFVLTRAGVQFASRIDQDETISKSRSGLPVLNVKT
mgnify:CR=1 FL=1